jgi:hypothetical protein
MAKHKYNQGDIVQFTHAGGFKRDLLVITEVFEILGSLRYAVHWLADNAKGRCKINTLDDDCAVRLVARA